MELTTTEKQSETILLKILGLQQPDKVAAVIFKHVKENAVTPEVFTVDHENHPTISKLVRTAGLGPIKMLIVMFLEETIQSLQVNQPTKEQVMEIATELINDHPTLKPEDYRIFFLNYRKGRYGKDFNRFDISTINLAMFQYLDERAVQHEQALASTRYRDDYSRACAIDMRKAYAKAMEEGRRKEDAKKGITERDRYRKEASDQYVKEFDDWCNTHGKYIDDENAIVEFASEKTFNHDYIDKFIADKKRLTIK